MTDTQLSSPSPETTATPATAAPPEVRRWTVPALDVQERDGDLRLVVDVPGVAAEHLDLQVRDGTLTLAARRADRPDEGWRRTLRLPDTVDQARVTATLRHGRLTLELPRAEATKPRRIDVRSA